jgi:DNA-binding XRE family transcriptional regulator
MITKTKTIYKNGNSKSYGAQRAQAENRYPRYQAAQALGVSKKAFDAGVARAGYRASEWHHHGRDARRVWYYDCEELSQSIEFWLGAIRGGLSKKKAYAIIRPIIKKRMHARLTPSDRNNPKFSLDIKNRVERLGISWEAFFKALPKDQTLGYPGQCVCVSNGEELVFIPTMNSRGEIEDCNPHLITKSKYIKPFDLTIENIRAVFQRSPSRFKFRSGYRPVLAYSWLTKGIENLKSGKSFNDHNSGFGINARSHNAKNIIIERYNQRVEKYQIEHNAMAIAH